VFPDLVIRGQPVSRDEIEAASGLDPSAYLALPEAGGSAESPLAQRDRFAADLIQRGMSPTAAVARARRTAESVDRRSR
jgi:hypothetical protein